MERLTRKTQQGYEVQDIQIFELSERTEVGVLLSSEDTSILSIGITVFEDPADVALYRFEKDDTPVQIIQVNGKTVYLLENLGVKNAVCQVGNVLCSVQGNLTQDETENIFASIGD